MEAKLGLPEKSMGVGPDNPQIVSRCCVADDLVTKRSGIYGRDAHCGHGTPSLWAFASH
jgi:hypothetical protein